MYLLEIGFLVGGVGEWDKEGWFGGWETLVEASDGWLNLLL